MIDQTIILAAFKALSAEPDPSLVDAISNASAISGLTEQASADLLVAIAVSESGGHNDKVSATQDYCAFQIHLPGATKTAEGYTAPDLQADVTKCTAVAVRMVSQSLAACHAKPLKHRLAVYARGKCESDSGRRLSAYKFYLAGVIKRARNAAKA